MSQKTEQQKIDEELDRQHEVKCERLAEEILQIMAKHKPPANLTGKPEQHERFLESYTPIYQDVVERFLAEQVQIKDAEYIMSIVKTFLELTERILGTSIRTNLKHGMKKILGKEEVELTFSDLDGIMKGTYQFPTDLQK